MMTPSPGCYENITNSFYSVKQPFMLKTLMLLQTRKIESNCFLIIPMAHTLRLYPSEMKNNINIFPIMKGGGENGFTLVLRCEQVLKGLFTAIQ